MIAGENKKKSIKLIQILQLNETIKRIFCTKP